MEMKDRANELANNSFETKDTLLESEQLNKQMQEDIFDKNIDIETMQTQMAKVGFFQSFKNKKNIKRNEKIQKDSYFLKQKVEKKIDKTLLNAEYEQSLTKEQIEYYNNHKEVLNFARLKEAHSLSHMKFIYALAIVPYILLSILNFIAEVAGGIISLINVFFESAFGKKVLIGYDDNKKPIYNVEKLNLVTRIFLSLIVVALLLFLVLALINAFTGFDLIEVLKSYTKKI